DGVVAQYSEVVFNGTDKSKVNNDPAVKNELRFNSGTKRWISDVTGGSSFTFGYSPSSTPMVTARFTNRNVDELREALTAYCGI
ncbi:MAG: hypothetical protein KC621_21270, partial [Myxococcales bacterium]|nr:hypothetical protein [Myxococcales bacterium]